MSPTRMRSTISSKEGWDEEEEEEEEEEGGGRKWERERRICRV